MASKPVKKQKENLARCAGEGKHSKGDIGEEKRIRPNLNLVMKSREDVRESREWRKRSLWFKQVSSFLGPPGTMVGPLKSLLN